MTETLFMEPADTIERILVVDDDALIRLSVVRILERAGFRTAPASDGKEALDMIVHELFGAVVTDLNMPRMNGLDLLQNIQSRFPWLPVIMMTGLATDEAREAALVQGAIAVFQKPVGWNNLIAAVALGLRGARAEAVDDGQSRFSRLSSPQTWNRQPPWLSPRSKGSCAPPRILKSLR